MSNISFGAKDRAKEKLDLPAAPQTHSRGSVLNRTSGCCFSLCGRQAAHIKKGIE